MKIRLFFAFALLAAGVGRLPAQGVSYTFDKDADFARFKTYKWVTIKTAQQLDELTTDQLISTVDVELAKKGLAKAESDKPDLLIAHQIASGHKNLLSNANVGLAVSSGNGGNAGAATATTTVHSGQLVLDMYDAKTEKLVWRGVVSNSINADAKPDKKQKHMDKAVEKLLKGYPPQKKP